MSQEQQDALDAAYRRASAEDAGRPGAATRRAILEQAASAARARTPAANDARFVWRAVAGIAVLGIAVLLWRQMDQHMPGQAPTAISVPLASDAVPATAATQEIPLPAAPVPAQRAAPAPPAAPPPPAPVFTPEAAMRTADARPTASAALAMEAQGAASAGTADAAPPPRSADARDTEASALLRERFPAVFQGRERRTIWLVRDARGTVVRSGELDAAQRLDDVTLQLEPTYGARLGAWRTQTVTNARDQQIVVAIAELQP